MSRDITASSKSYPPSIKLTDLKLPTVKMSAVMYLVRHRISDHCNKPENIKSGDNASNSGRAKSKHRRNGEMEQYLSKLCNFCIQIRHSNNKYN